jgi:hypothetical protein
MHVVYDPRHVLHDPATEVQYGVAMPMYEVPARVESIRTALLGSARLVRRTGAAASVVRPGNDLTLVTNQLARRETEAAAGDDVQPVGGGREQQPA